MLHRRWHRIDVVGLWVIAVYDRTWYGTHYLRDILDSEWLSLVRHSMAAVVLVLLLMAEGVIPEFGRVANGRWRHAWRNLGLAACNGVIGIVCLAPLVAMTSNFVAGRSFGAFYWIGGDVWALVVVLVLFDLWMYCWHRMNHEWGVLWRLHRVHHTDVAMDASTALRFHPGEIAASTLVRLAVMPILGMTASHLLIYEIILLPVILLQHSSLHAPHGIDKFIRVLIVTPWMHRIHHSTVRDETDSNYGSVLSVWDRLFGSWRWRSDPENIVFGLEANRSDADQSVAGMLKTPFAAAKSKND